MKTVVLICSLFVLMVSANLTHAHPNHVLAEPVSDLQVTDRADFLKRQLVVEGKLDASWSDVNACAVERHKVDHRKLWVVRYDDARITPGRFFIVLDALGNLVTANHTGHI